MLDNHRARRVLSVSTASRPVQALAVCVPRKRREAACLGLLAGSGLFGGPIDDIEQGLIFRVTTGDYSLRHCVLGAVFSRVAVAWDRMSNTPKRVV
jgi:hypothetical protein